MLYPIRAVLVISVATIVLGSRASAAEPFDTEGHMGLVLAMNGSLPQAREDPISIDLTGDNIPEELPFPTAGAGYLVHDTGARRGIDRWNELLDVVAVVQLDDNGDGWLDGQDDAFGSLRIWSKTDAGKDQFTSLTQAGIASIYTQSTQSGVAGFFRSDGNIGFMMEVELEGEGWTELAPIATCDDGNPKGDCEDKPLPSPPPVPGWHGRQCKHDLAKCTNNVGGAGTCGDAEHHEGAGDVLIYCLCSGSSKSPVIDENWSMGLGALLLGLTVAFGRARQARSRARAF